MVRITGFGNPLLDITVKIPDNSLVEKYNLNADDQKEITDTKIKELLKDISILQPIYSAGGSAQNTLRILQWVLAQRNSTIMIGGIGLDAQGQKLQKLVEESGVETCYIVHRDNPTGTAVALISGANRSLVAYIGAAQNISDLIYMEGFFLPHRIDTVKYIHKYCYENERPFVFNLSASYICMNHSDDAMFLAQNCDILIGNYKEFQALLTAANLMEDIKSFAMRLSQGYKNVKKLPYGKIIIITNGSKSVICAHTGGIVEEIPVPKIDTNKIGDTNGAGDAFAAGFLAGLFAQQTPIGCLKWGCWVAHQIIQQVGCTIPSYTAEVLKGINE